MKGFLWFIAIATLRIAAIAQGPENTMIFGYAGGNISPDDVEFGLNVLTFSCGSLQIGDNQQSEAFFNDTNAAISDSTGNLLFYFNGIDVFSKEHFVMQNGAALNVYNFSGYDLPQGAIILPYPGHPDQYILFHGVDGYVDIPGWTTSCVGLYYSIIDMTYNNGLGKVTERKTPLFIDTLEYGKLAVCRHANGRDWWMTVGKSHTNIFYSVLISPEGVNFVSSQAVGLVREDSFGQASFSPDGTKYIISGGFGAPPNSGQSIEIYEFDRRNGTLSDHQRIVFHDDNNTLMGSIISPNSRWLYAPSIQLLYKFDLWADSVESSKELIAEYEPFNDPFPTPFMMGFLAPDDKIYIYTTSGSRTLHVIHKPDEPGTDCAFEQHGIRLPCYNSSSLPTFANYRLGPLDGSVCDTLGIDNDPVSWWRYEQDTLDPLAVEFRDLSYYEPDTWAWDFNDGNTSAERHPDYTFDSAGIYQVCLTVSNINGAHMHCKTLYLGVTGADEPMASPYSASIVPNPSQDQFRVQVEGGASNAMLRVQVVDANGNVVRDASVQNGQVLAHAFAPGFYVCRIYLGEELANVVKLVIMP